MMWQVIDAMYDEAVVIEEGNKETSSKNKAIELCAYLNTAADWFCNKPRYYTRDIGV